MSGPRCRGSARWRELAEEFFTATRGLGGRTRTARDWEGRLVSGQPEPQRWIRIGALRGTSVSDAGGARGAAAAGTRSAGPGGPHVRAAEPAAAIPGARGGVWGKPPPAAGNGGGLVPEPSCDGGTGEGRQTLVDCRGARGRGAAGARGPPLARAGRGGARRSDLGACLGAFPRSPASKHVNKAWCVRGGRVQPPRGAAVVAWRCHLGRG